MEGSFNPGTHREDYAKVENELASTSEKISGEKGNEELMSLIAKRDELRKHLEDMKYSAHEAANEDNIVLDLAVGSKKETEEEITQLQEHIKSVDIEIEKIKGGANSRVLRVERKNYSEAIDTLEYISDFSVDKKEVENIFPSITTFRIKGSFELYGDKLLESLKRGDYPIFFTRNQVNYILTSGEYNSILPEEGDACIFFVKEENEHVVFVRAFRNSEGDEYGVDGWGFADYKTEPSGNSGDGGDIVFVRNK